MVSFWKMIIFKFFYSNSKNFNKDQSFRVDLTGSDEFQKINLEVPIKGTKHLRLDVGVNPSQKEILLRSIILKTESGEVKYDGSIISKYFVPNKFVTIDNEILKLYEISSIYNPYLISTDLVTADVINLSRIKNYLSPDISISIAMILAMSIYFFCVLGVSRKLSVPSEKIVFITAFAIILLIPLVFKTLALEPKTDFLEKRELSKKPEFEFSETYTRKFEAYYNDNFGLRSTFVKYSGL